MQTTVTERGQISIPAEIRRKFKLEAGRGIEWVVTGEAIYLFPVPKDPIAAFQKKSTGLYEVLMEERRKDREREK